MEEPTLREPLKRERGRGDREPVYRLASKKRVPPSERAYSPPAAYGAEEFDRRVARARRAVKPRYR
jgi:hypothetical protein